ncbi:hypothetical protein SAMN05660199_00829 [Klenkia soli]|uniref:Uncharacterized protein n=1 Tax=Klenkia soli TaxID=1052260 RepID=A0A1H0EQ30_9ACTN|nr:hypothetical protein [Klenkia soli]SDN84567.1 hypothetical protein SAMN05660199_00829 [Klenkia soli]
MTATALDPLGHVLGRLQRLLGVGVPAEDLAVSVVTRFLTGDEPTWLRRCTEEVRLDVLTVHGVLAARRG